MLDRVETFISGELETRRIPGAAIAVVRPGEPVWSRGFGTANVETGEPFTPETPFGIQSITKTFVGTSIMQLQEMGLLSVDDVVAKHLPGVVQNEWEAENPVLVRHLLTHTSGLPVDTAGGPPGGPRTLEEYVRLVAKTVRPPDTETVYANWGYDIAGLLIEALTGETWHGYIDKHICEPLGMRSTGVHPPEHAAYGHFLSAVDGELHRLGRAEWPVDPSDPAGGIVSTVEDLAMFASAHLNDGGPILSPETVARMQRVSAGEPGGGGMVLGLRATRSNGKRLLCHGGDGSGFTNFIGLYPDEGIAVALTLNRGGMQAARAVIGNGVLAVVADDGDAPAGRRYAGGVGVVAPDGLYVSNFWDIELAVETTAEKTSARPLSGLVVSDGAEPSILVPAGDATFVGSGGMLGGFEVNVGADGAIYGGLYPYRFARLGDVPATVDEPLDETADLVGSWTGTITTPMGALALSVEVADGVSVAISTPFGQDLALEECDATAGRLCGRFTLTVPTVGEMIMYPRLEVRAGKLKGPIYAQGWFGELPMPAELERA
jgi:CubicO group peptidase (beta-lactamase class C family)